MPSNASQPARSHYRGIRVTINQTGPEKPCLVTVSTKQLDRSWDQWDLLFPAIRVPVAPEGIDGYVGILRLIQSAFAALIEADQRYR